MPTTQPTRSAFLAALREARKQGAVIKQNVSGCCRGCISADSETKLGLKGDDETTPYAWSYGGQGFAYSWDQDKPVWRDSLNKARASWSGRVTAKLVDEIYFNHGNGGAEILVGQLRTAGFNVEWDGTNTQCVVVKFS